MEGKEERNRRRFYLSTLTITDKTTGFYVQTNIFFNFNNVFNTYLSPAPTMAIVIGSLGVLGGKNEAII